MGEKIYGVDLSKEITPWQVRDVMHACFVQAHCDVLAEMKEYHEFKSEAEFEEMKQLDVAMLIKSIFGEIGADFENPTKKDLLKVVDKLSVYASKFRKPDIIEKHHAEIMMLINKLT